MVSPLDQGDAQAHALQDTEWREADPELQRALHGPGVDSERGERSTRRLRSLTDDDFVPLTVNQLLLGRTSGTPLQPQAVQEEQYFGVGRYQQDMWWTLWKEQGLASLLPYGHLKEAKRHANLEVGDVCLLNYDNKVCGTYRLRPFWNILKKVWI